MPRPPAINWYRADLRSPLPGGLRRPGRSFISIAFVFLFSSRSASSRPPSPSSGVRAALYWLSRRMDGGRNGRIWQRKRCFGDIDGAQLLSLSLSPSRFLSLSLRGGSGTKNTRHPFLCVLECSLCAFHAHPVETRVLLLGPFLHPAGLPANLHFSPLFLLLLLSPAQSLVPLARYSAPTTRFSVCGPGFYRSGYLRRDNNRFSGSMSIHPTP